MVSCDRIDSADKNWQFLWGFKVLSAVQQNQSTADEVVRSMVGQLERGFQVAQPPYGYVGVREREKDGRGGTHWVVDSPTALKALCALVPEGQEEQVQEECATVLREARDPERIPTLLTGTPVRIVSVTAVPPGDLLARWPQAIACRQEDGRR